MTDLVISAGVNRAAVETLGMVQRALTVLVLAYIVTFASPALAQAPGAKETQKNTDGTTSITEPYEKGGTIKTTENAKGETVDVVITQPDATFGAGGTKLSIHLDSTPWTRIEDNPSLWIYKDKSGKVLRIVYNKDLNGEDFRSFTVDYGADGRIKTYTKEVHTGNPEMYPDGVKTSSTFDYDKFGRPLTVVEDFTDEEYKVKRYRTTYAYAGDGDKNGTATVEVPDDATGKWATQPSSAPTPLQAAANEAGEIRKTIAAVTERRISLVEDLDLGNALELSIDRADADTAGTPKPLEQPQPQKTEEKRPGFWGWMPPIGMGIQREEMKDRERGMPDDRRR